MLHNSPCPTPQPTHTPCPEVPYHLTEQLRDPRERHQGAGVLRLPPPPPWAAGTKTSRTGWPAACHPPAMGPSRRRHCAGCWHRRRCRGRGGGGGGAARRLMEFLAARRYSAGQMRLITGGRKRRVAASAAWTEMGRPRGRCPPIAFRRESSAPLLPPPVAVDRRGPRPGRRLL